MNKVLISLGCTIREVIKNKLFVLAVPHSQLLNGIVIIFIKQTNISKVLIAQLQKRHRPTFSENWSLKTNRKHYSNNTCINYYKDMH